MNLSTKERQLGLPSFSLSSPPGLNSITDASPSVVYGRGVCPCDWIISPFLKATSIPRVTTYIILSKTYPHSHILESDSSGLIRQFRDIETAQNHVSLISQLGNAIT